MRRGRGLAAAAAVAAGLGCATAGSGGGDSPVRIVVVSDLNAAYGSTTYPPAVSRVVERIVEEWRPDAVLIAGDLIAGQSPALPDSAVRAMWRAFDAMVARPLLEAGIPLLPALGNHDASAYPAHARDRALALEHWRAHPLRAAVPFVNAAGFPLRYTASLGEVFVVVWDATRQESARDEELLSWVRDALASPAARAARHRVVLGHLPLYGVAEGRNRPGEVLAAGDSLRRKLEAWGATLYVSGHHHAYYPGRRGGLELLHAGALGGGPRPLLGSDARPRKTVTLLEFRRDAVEILTYEVDEETGRLSPVPITDLPRALCGLNGPVIRRDLAPLDTLCP